MLPAGTSAVSRKRSPSRRQSVRAVPYGVRCEPELVEDRLGEGGEVAAVEARRPGRLPALGQRGHERTCLVGVGGVAGGRVCLGEGAEQMTGGVTARLHGGGFPATAGLGSGGQADVQTEGVQQPVGVDEQQIGAGAAHVGEEGALPEADPRTGPDGGTGERFHAVRTTCGTPFGTVGGSGGIPRTPTGPGASVSAGPASCCVVRLSSRRLSAYGSRSTVLSRRREGADPAGCHTVVGMSSVSGAVALPSRRRAASEGEPGSAV